MFSVLQGTAEALVRWDGKIYHPLTDYILSNISAKNYWTQIIIIIIII